MLATHFVLSFIGQNLYKSHEIYMVLILFGRSLRYEYVNLDACM